MTPNQQIQTIQTKIIQTILKENGHQIDQYQNIIIIHNPNQTHNYIILNKNHLTIDPHHNINNQTKIHISDPDLIPKLLQTINKINQP